MGSSTTHRGGPSFQKNITGRGTEKYTASKMSTMPQGDTISTGKTLRQGLKASAGKQSSSSRSSVKAPVPSGRS